MRESTQTLAWYDRLAALYNVTRDYPYGTARRHAIDRLALRPGECVFDLFCGTGVNLPLLHTRVFPAGRVVGVDGSSAMLAKAQRATQHLNSMELGCLRRQLLVVLAYPLARKALTPLSFHSSGHKHYFGCNLLHRNVLTSHHQQ